jgi:hypothetical protein
MLAGSACGIYESVYHRLMEGKPGELAALLPEFVYAALVPYVGEDAAAALRRELIDEPDSAAAEIGAA